MSAPRCYLDYNATSPLRAEARDAVVAALGMTGNPSSIHGEGRAARRLVEQARRQVAALVGGDADRVIFTAGATEAANATLAPDLKGPSAPAGTRRILIGATEHPAIRQGHRFPAEAVSILPVDANGRLVLDAMAVALAADRTPALLALQAANNETGVIQPVREAAELVHAAGGLVVCDAVQIAGRLLFDLNDAGVDAVLLSSHKLGGPQGTGAVVFGQGVTFPAALLRGGGQERGFRSGTENVAGLAGFGAVACSPQAAEIGRLRALQARLETALASDVVVFGRDADRLPNTTCLAAPGTAAETLLIALDLAGVAVSSGSACSSGKVARSHVLEAMGVPPGLAGGALRVSTGWASSEMEIDRFVDAYDAALKRLRRRPLPAAA